MSAITHVADDYHASERTLDSVAWHYFTPPEHRKKMTTASRTEGYIALTHARKCGSCRAEYEGLKEIYSGITATRLGSDAFTDFLMQKKMRR